MAHTQSIYWKQLAIGLKQLGGGFGSKYVLPSPLLGEDFQFDEHIFSDGLVQPPTRRSWKCVEFEVVATIRTTLGREASPPLAK